MSADPNTEFVELLARHDRALTLYVYGLVPLHADADDVLQQTKMIMWKCFGDFETGTNFIAWARRIAFHQILGYRRKSKRDPLPLSDEMMEKIGDRLADMSEHEQIRCEALESCLHRLSGEHRRLIHLRYHEDLGVDEIAGKLSSTPGAVYRALSRLRLGLVDCVRSRIENLQHSAS
jgi:RNA polymerase sigma-70 factor (ECF subfamily)